MEISIFGVDPSRAAASTTSLDTIRAQIQRADRQGFSGYWLPQATGLDSMTALAATASGADIPVGVAVVPVYTPHPVALAQQALTANEALDGRLTLGVGSSHRVFVERVWGLSFDNPVSYMAEYLEILLLLLNERQAYMRGRRLVMRGQLDLDGPACPVMIAALGPRMLELAGRMAAGTITWMAGPKTIRDFIAPDHQRCGGGRRSQRSGGGRRAAGMRYRRHRRRPRTGYRVAQQRGAVLVVQEPAGSGGPFRRRGHLHYRQRSPCVGKAGGVLHSWRHQHLGCSYRHQR